MGKLGSPNPCLKRERDNTYWDINSQTNRGDCNVFLKWKIQKSYRGASHILPKLDKVKRQVQDHSFHFQTNYIGYKKRNGGLGSL